MLIFQIHLSEFYSQEPSPCVKTNSPPSSLMWISIQSHWQPIFILHLIPWWIFPNFAIWHILHWWSQLSKKFSWTCCLLLQNIPNCSYIANEIYPQKLPRTHSTANPACHQRLQKPLNLNSSLELYRLCIIKQIKKRNGYLTIIKLTISVYQKYPPIYWLTNKHCLNR